MKISTRLFMCMLYISFEEHHSKAVFWLLDLSYKLPSGNLFLIKGIHIWVNIVMTRSWERMEGLFFDGECFCVCAGEQPSLAPYISHSSLTSHGWLALTENTHSLGSVTSSSGSESCLTHSKKKTKAAGSGISVINHILPNILIWLIYNTESLYKNMLC